MNRKTKDKKNTQLRQTQKGLKNAHRYSREHVADLKELNRRATADNALRVARDKEIAEFARRKAKAYFKAPSKLNCVVTSQRALAHFARVYIALNQRRQLTSIYRQLTTLMRDSK